MTVSVPSRTRRLRFAVLAGVLGASALAAGISTAAAAPDPGMSVAPMPVAAVPLAQAGEVVMWGDNAVGQLNVPAALQGVAVTQVVTGDDVVLALTAEGKVVGWGGNAARLQRVPAAVTAETVAQVVSGGSMSAGVVTRDGRVLVWGLTSKFGTAVDVPPGLTDVVQLALAQNSGMALKSDGTVVAWGRASEGITAVPDGLRAQKIGFGACGAYALTQDGTVVTWGNGSPTTEELPAELRQPGNVKAIGAASCGAAVLADDSLLFWGFNGKRLAEAEMAASLRGIKVRSLAGGSDSVVVLGQDGNFREVLMEGRNTLDRMPAELNGRAVASFSVGRVNGAVLVTAMLRVTLPQVAGTAAVGSVLSGAPGTFSGAPDAVVGHWLANGAAIPGATGDTLTLTPDLAGKQVAYQSTAVKAGAASVSTLSAPVTVAGGAGAPVVVPPPAAPAPGKGPNTGTITSSTKVLKVVVAKKAAKVTVTGKVTAPVSPAGSATVVIAKGKKTIVTKSVPVSAKGALALTVKKFANLVAKKVKSKGVGGYRGKYTVRISYAGNAQVKASTASKAFTIKR